MALKLPKFLSGTDAKSRVFLIFAAVVVFAFLIYIAVRFLGGGATTGSSSVANAPGGLQSVPGAKMSPEFYRAVMQANQQASQQAQISGGSAVPTLINVPQQQQQAAFPQQGNCTVLCNEEAVNVADDINELVKNGKLPQEDANKLLDMAKRNVSVSEYADALNELVRQGKLTPDQARKLLADYKKQHQNVLAAESGLAMDSAIKSGQLPIDVANSLLALQKSGISPADYAAELNRLVKEGKISPQLAAQLLGQYTQQLARESAKEGAVALNQMARAGQITQDVANTLADLQKRNVPVDEYAAELDRLVKAGKMTPEAAAKLLARYKAQRASVGAMGSLNAQVAQEEANSVNQLSDMMKAGKITPDVANALFALQQKGASAQEYQAALDALVKAGKLSPEDAKKLMAQYQKLAGLKAVSKKLADLQGNNASLADYTNALKDAVKAGVISPDTANELLAEYRGIISPGIAPTIETAIPGTEAFAQLQQRVQQQQAAGAVVEGPQFTATETQAVVAANDERQQAIKQLMGAMSGQAQSLINSWRPPVMREVVGSYKEKSKEGPGGLGPGNKPPSDNPEAAAGPVLVKAGTILFAVLETAIDSDYPDTPVMATIIDGNLKGAKLLGKIALASSPTGVTGNDKVSITFNLMNRDDWPKSKAIQAFAIDPDTARTVMASNVNYHYLLRYGSMMASSFITGYASAITQSGGTTTTGIFGTSTTNPATNPGQKFLIGLGKIGETLGNATSNYINTPPTVKVNSGVGLGILFMADLTA